MSGTRHSEGLRFAARVSGDPAGTVRGWKAASGWKAVLCPRGFPVPEIPHSVDLIPVFAGSPEETRALLEVSDGWIVEASRFDLSGIPWEKPRFLLPVPWPQEVEGTLDRLEALAEWAGTVAGRPVREGALLRSMRAYREVEFLSRHLSGRCESEPGFLDPERLEDLRRSRDVLPAGAYSVLLSAILGEPLPPPDPGEGTGDPLLFLARRIDRKRG